MSRILIAYFSRAGENYFGGAIRTVKVGNTEIAANFIQKLTDADVYKIEMKTPYSQDYKTCVSEAVRDLKSSARPEIIDPPEDIHGYDTVIGEGGSTLSGGEKQRISIARAFLKDAPIILLDEATASLDVENETAIQEALSRLIKDKTVLIIAHRMRTVSSADKIVVLKDGAVAEQGSPAQLLHKGGIFAHMVQLQTKSQGWSLIKA